MQDSKATEIWEPSLLEINELGSNSLSPEYEPSTRERERE